MQRGIRKLVNFGCVGAAETELASHARSGRAKTGLYYFFADGTETCKLRDSATIPSSLLRTAALFFPRRASLSLRAWDTVASSSPGALSRVFSACSRQAKT